MALVVEDAADRAEQLLLVTQRLTALIAEETRRIEAREPPLSGAEADEKNRLANTYRLELARIKHDKSLIEGAAANVLVALRQQTTRLHVQLEKHELALGAVKLVAEGMVQAMAAEVARQRAGAAGYGASGALDAPAGPNPAVLDKTA